MQDFQNKQLHEAILNIGEVCGIEGTKIHVIVNKNKNASDLFYEGSIVKNVSVGSFVEIRKGFISIIGKVDGERLSEEKVQKIEPGGSYQLINYNKRILTLSLIGYIDFDKRFYGGIKELPLLGDYVFILTESKIHQIHNFKNNRVGKVVKIASTASENIPIDLPVDGIFNGHIAIFGNTGSGKSNTLASLYKNLFQEYTASSDFDRRCKFIIFDFNGEYSEPDCIKNGKTVFKLSTHGSSGQKIPLRFADFFDVETLSILVEATDKTQKPFIRRSLWLMNSVTSATSKNEYLIKIIKNRVKDVLSMANKDSAYKVLDYLTEVIRPFVTDEVFSHLRDKIEFHSSTSTFKVLGEGTYFNSSPSEIENTKLFIAASEVTYDKLKEMDAVAQFLIFLHLQLIDDLLKYRAQNDHVYPVVNRTLSKQASIKSTFEISEQSDLWSNSNLVVIDLSAVNLDMRKTIPLLLAKKVYGEHKNSATQKSLNIIIDEAHNILSKSSFRETEDWKDYRLETFEEIIKEGRKFGVFLTISSQRPSDISDTIISQAHNYFIHQLVNDRDLLMVKTAVSYIDKISEESIPSLPVGVCIFSGVATAMPIKLKIHELDDRHKPNSKTLKFSEIA